MGKVGVWFQVMASKNRISDIFKKEAHTMQLFFFFYKYYNADIQYLISCCPQPYHTLVPKWQASSAVT